MATQSIDIKVTAEKPLVPGSEDNRLVFTSYETGEQFEFADTEHVGLDFEWFPFQDRFTKVMPRIGVYAGGSYSQGLLEPVSDSWDDVWTTNRFDWQLGLRLALDIPFKKSALAPYVGSGINNTIYSDFPDLDYAIFDCAVPGYTYTYEARPTHLYDTFSPQVGIDVALGKVSNADIIVNSHAQWLDFNSRYEQWQILIGGGLGVGF